MEGKECIASPVRTNMVPNTKYNISTVAIDSKTDMVSSSYNRNTHV